VQPDEISLNDVVECIAKVGSRGQHDADVVLRDLDSLQLVHLVADLEATFHIEIPDVALSDAMFTSAESLHRGIRRIVVRDTRGLP
jgi:acyl carrier protein